MSDTLHFIPISVSDGVCVPSSMYTEISRAVKCALEYEGVVCACEIDVLLTDDAEIHELNRRLRDVDRATDVLSFPAFDLTPGTAPEDTNGVVPDEETGRIPLGDMVLSLERVHAQAEEYGHSVRRELCYLVVHSVLHLLGYDHMEEDDYRLMREHEEKIMELLDCGIAQEREESEGMETMTTITKEAMVTVCGRPNVGKSSLTNALVGEKIAIVSPKPQTTRNRIYGVVNRGDTQIVLLDTPGLHKSRSRLGDYMVKVVEESLSGIDAIMMMVEPVAKIGKQEEVLIERLRRSDVPALLVINKIDTVKKEDILPVIALYSEAYAFDTILPVSARTGDGLEQLFTALSAYAKDGPQLFPDGMTTDQPDAQVCAEIVREKILQNLDREIPHGVAIEVTKFSQRDSGIIDLDVTIYCEKASHKGILIGKNGAMLKKVSSAARREIEGFMGEKVYLQTWVKVRENWRDNLNYVRSFGYRE